MVEIWLPYGKTEVCARIPAVNFLGSLEPKEKPGVQNPEAEIERAMRKPLGTKQLRETAKSGDRVAIVVDDATRPTPSYLMIPKILDELSSSGVKNEDVTIIFACGIHRGVKDDEMKGLLGEETLKKVRAVNHNPQADDQVHLGTTSFGTEVYLNRIFAEADVKILTGDVGLHYYAGYGGGRKSVLPGVASVQSIQSNHALLLRSNARTGILEGNPVHEDMVEAARLAEVDFTLNLVTNSKREVVKAFAGDIDQVLQEGVKLVDEMYKVSLERGADIVVVSSGGHPFDINLYQAYKGIDNALNAVKRGGVIVLVAECPEGHGHDIFYEWMTEFKSLKKMEKALNKNFLLGGHKAYHLRRVLERAHIILVSVMPDYYAINTFDLKTARTVNDALRNAFNLAGKNAKVWAMPHGNITLPITKTAE